MVLNIVHDIERRARAVALASTYVARTTAVFVPTVEVGLIGFFANQSDPAVSSAICYFRQPRSIYKTRGGGSARARTPHWQAKVSS
jgi:hypothetical protein